MRKLFKTSFIALSALVLPFTASLVTRAEETTYKDDIDTKLEYQISSDGSDIRYISTMELKNDRTLNDITSIQMEFIITDGTVDRSRIETTTTVYDRITGTKDRVDDTYYAVFKITDLTDKYTGWRISSNFTYYFADSTHETVTASSWLIGGERLYYKKIYSDWGDIKAYMWQSSNESNINKTFPGEDMEYDSVNNVYFYDYLPSKGYDKIIFSDGSNQSEDTFLSSTYNHYLQKNEHAYPVCSYTHTLESDGANTHSCPICGYSEAHTLTGTTNGDNRTVTCSECGFEHTYPTNIVYVTDNVSWGRVYAYIFDSSDKHIGNEWPGTLMTNAGKNEDGDTVYSIEIPANAAYIIFTSNYGGDANQTVNIPLSDFSTYNAAYLISHDNGKKTIGTWLCIESELTTE